MTRDASEIARTFQRGIAQGLCDAIALLATAQRTETVVLSGGVFQNELLLNDPKNLWEGTRLQIWTHHVVPSNDGGISLGQAALAALAQHDSGVSDEKCDPVRVEAVR
jgi:hydrogenase maturation protein HypF